MQVIDQTRCWVFLGERVPAGEKIVSLFEAHAGIIVKDRRAVHYGHKLNQTSDCSGLFFDAVIESGNPADVERWVPFPGRWLPMAATLCAITSPAPMIWRCWPASPPLNPRDTRADQVPDAEVRLSGACNS